MTVQLSDRPCLAVDDSNFVDALTRRQFLGGATAVALGLGLAACGGTSATKDAAGAGKWHYTDDRGKTVRLDARPSRIAFLTDTVGASLWAAGTRPVAATNSHSGIVQAVGFDFSGVKDIGTGSPGINLEALAAAKPDLLVDAVQADGTLQTTSNQPKTADIAPVVGLNMYRPIQTIVGNADRLTTAVGDKLVDLGAQARYDQAATALRTAVAANPDLRVAFVFDISTSALGVMNEATWPVLKTVAGLGLELVPVPSGAENLYSQKISWEDAGEIPADFVVWAVSDPLPTDPGWAAMPAVRAGQYWKPQIASWYAYSYANFAGLLSNLAGHVRTAKAGIGPQ